MVRNMWPQSLNRQQSAMFPTRCLLSFDSSDERQMRPLHDLAKIASWQNEARESCRLPWGALHVRRFASQKHHTGSKAKDGWFGVGGSVCAAGFGVGKPHRSGGGAGA